ncbi:MAG TPA: hypothetical protein VFQ12_09340 [Thermoleophilaceae bacterium]|nr:hypothetical protein [Thermoleophilaceae bacterium]
MSDEPQLRDPGRVVVSAYLLAGLCLLVPLAAVGAVFAGAVLARRNRPRTGAAVIALALLCTGLGIALLR